MADLVGGGAGGQYFSISCGFSDNFAKLHVGDSWKIGAPLWTILDPLLVTTDIIFIGKFRKNPTSPDITKLRF